MFLKHKNSYFVQQHYAIIIICCIGIAVVAAVTSFVYRGIYPDDLPRYSHWAEAILSQKGLGGNDPDSIAAVLYQALIAVASVLVGKDLLAAHLFPYLFAVATPIVMFLLLRRILRHSLWACVGTIGYIFFPTNFIWTNQPLTEPIFLFWLVATMLLVEMAQTRHSLLILVGITAALMSLTRLFDGFFCAALAGIAIICQHRKQFPLKWGIWAILSFIGVHLLASIVFDYSLLQYYAYYRQMLDYPYQNSSPVMKTVTAMKIFMQWYFYKYLTPVFLVVIIVGIIHNLRHNILYPFICLSGYACFLLFVYQGRYVDTFVLRLGVKLIPCLIVLMMSGIKWSYDTLLARHHSIAAYALAVGMFVLFGVTFVQENQIFFNYMADIIPSSSLSKVLQHPSIYEQARREAASLAQFPEFASKAFREAVIQEVLGAYRPSYRTKVAQKFWDDNVPSQQMDRADFSYHETFSEPETWKTNIIEISGDSPLWTPDHPDIIGAFPAGASARIMYKFSFPRKIQQITLGDIHTQWGPGDVVRMSTSFDGAAWTVRYDDSLRNQKVYYYETVTWEVPVHQDLFVKYDFHAGDPARDPSDNRGASVHEFFLAVTFAQ